MFRTESEQNWFSENRTSWLFSLHLLFVICLWTCLLNWVQTTYESVSVNFFNAIRIQNKIAESRAKFHKFRQRIALVFNKISEKFPRNSFFLKFHVSVSTEFGTKRDKFQVKRMRIHVGKKSNSFRHKRTFLSGLAVTNKKFIPNSVGGVQVSNLSQNSVDTMNNVW